MKKVDRIFVKVIATIAVILVASIIAYFATAPNALDGTWNHTYFPSSILFFCVVGLIGFFIQKRKIIIKERCSDDYGNNSLDFEHKCCFREQIVEIGEGTKDGSGEEVRVKMQSGKTAIFKLFSEKYNYIGDYTGQRNWRYHFVKYVEE